MNKLLLNLKSNHMPQKRGSKLIQSKSLSTSVHFIDQSSSLFFHREWNSMKFSGMNPMPVYLMLLYVSWGRGENFPSSGSWAVHPRILKLRPIYLFFNPPIINTDLWHDNEGSENDYEDECDVNLKIDVVDVIVVWNLSQFLKDTLISSVHQCFLVVEEMLWKF